METITKNQRVIFNLCSSGEEIVQKITDRVISLVNSNPSCNLGLSFSMPLIPVYHSLVFDYNTNKTNYSNVRTYNLSEFISSSPLKWTFRKIMNRSFFSFMNIKSKNIFFPYYTSNYETAKYDRLIWKNGGIDLQLLVVERDGYIAYQEANADPNNLTSVTLISKELRERTIPLFGETIDETPETVVTMGIRTMLNSKSIIMIADDKKALNALVNLYKEKINPAQPCTYFAQHPNVSIFLSKNLSSLFKKNIGKK